MIIRLILPAGNQGFPYFWGSKNLTLLQEMDTNGSPKNLEGGKESERFPAFTEAGAGRLGPLPERPLDGLLEKVYKWQEVLFQRQSR